MLAGAERGRQDGFKVVKGTVQCGDTSSKPRNQDTNSAPCQRTKRVGDCGGRTGRLERQAPGGESQEKIELAEFLAYPNRLRNVLLSSISNQG